MHYYTFNIGDYHSHTAHLDPIEDLAYRRMLDWVYLHESPLPDNIKQIAKLIRLPDEYDRIASVLREYFDLSEYGYTQKKAMQEIERFKSKSDKARAAINERWARERENRDTDVLRTKNERNTNHKPITNNHKEKDLSNDRSKNVTVHDLVAFGIDDQVAKDFQSIRKAKRSPLTKTALSAIEREAGKAGWSVQQAITECVARGWQGFKAEWVQNKGPPSSYQQKRDEERARTIEGLTGLKRGSHDKQPIDITSTATVTRPTGVD